MSQSFTPYELLTVFVDPVQLLEMSKNARAKALADIASYCHADMAAIFDKMLPTDVIIRIANAIICVAFDQLCRCLFHGSIAASRAYSRSAYKTLSLAPLPRWASGAYNSQRCDIFLFDYLREM